MATPKKYSRRDFLRLCLYTAAGAALSQVTPGCSRLVPPAEPSPLGTANPSLTATPSIEPGAGPGITLVGGDADAWDWEQPVRGKLFNINDCQQITILAHGEKYTAIQEGDHFSASIPLVEGENQIEAICQRANGAEETSNMLHYQERLRRTPTAFIDISLEENRIVLDGSQSRPVDDHAPALTSFLWSALPINPADLLQAGVDGAASQVLTEVNSPTIQVLPPTLDGEYYLRLKVMDQSGRSDTSTIYFTVINGQAHIPDFDTENPAWVENAIVYGVIPRNFGSPAFQAITGKLDYLADLGVNALWLAPVNISPPDDYGYAVVDYFALNPKYGSQADFRRLVQEAHNRGIRLLMDFVPNHSSAKHPYYLSSVESGKDSPYWDFYDRDENGNVSHYFDWSHLPNLNFDNPNVRNWITEAFAYWVREFDVDGFRVDAAWGIRQRRPDYWPQWRRALKRIKPDLLLLAEASARDLYYFDNGFDAAYDWTDQLGRWAWELVWDSYKNRLLSYNLEAALTNRPVGFHPDALIFRFLNNNDTGDRFITRYGEGMTRVATALLLTLPGIPCIYTGDEVGEEFRPYDNPQPLTWKEAYPGLREYHQKLIALRKNIPSLHSRSWLPLEIKPIPQEVYAYVRYLEPDQQSVVILLNFFEEKANVEFSLPQQFKPLVEKAPWFDALTGEPLQNISQDAGQVLLPGLTAKILIQKM